MNNKSRNSSLLLCCLLATGLISGCSGQVKKQEASNYNSELGVRYLQKGRLQLANDKLTKALEQDPKSAQTNHYYALLQQRLGNNKLASKHFLKAIAIDPKNSDIHNNYGSYLCKNKQPHAAVRQFLIAVKDPLYRTPAYAYTNAGICLRKSNNHAKAEKYFRLALKKHSAFPSALFEMAKLYKDKGNYSKAQAFMLRYETVGKSTPEALELCVDINSKMRNEAKAGSCKSALLRLFPSSSEAEKINRLL